MNKDQFLNSWARELAIESTMIDIDAKKFLYTFYDKVVKFNKLLEPEGDCPTCDGKGGFIHEGGVSDCRMCKGTGKLTSQQPSEEEIDKTIERIEDMHPFLLRGRLFGYKESGNKDSYSEYNEGWTDACAILGQAIKELLNR